MAVDKHVRGYVRPTKVHTESAQRDMLTAKIVYVEGKRGGSRADIIRDLRRGDVLEVAHLALLAEPKSKQHPNPHRDLYETMRQIEAKGLMIREAATGWLSNDPEQRDAMIFRAGEMIRAGRRTKEQARINASARAIPYTAEQRAIMERVYFDLRFPSIGAAVAELARLGIKTNKIWLFRAFGPSGRPRSQKRS